eukprot:363330-Chlamydomonas_euryale.AAC.21
MLQCDWPSQSTRTSSGGVDGTVCQSFASHKTPIHPEVWMGQCASRLLRTRPHTSTGTSFRPPSWPYFTKLCALCFVHGILPPFLGGSCPDSLGPAAGWRPLGRTPPTTRWRFPARTEPTCERASERCHGSRYSPRPRLGPGWAAQVGRPDRQAGIQPASGEAAGRTPWSASPSAPVPPAACKAYEA